MDAKQCPQPAWIDDLHVRFPTERTIAAALTRKLSQRAGPPYTPSSLDDIGQRLKAFLSAQSDGAGEVANVRPLGGGASKEQYRFDLIDPQGRSTTYVLRREPPESVVETHRLREFQMMRALEGTVPVPHARWVDAEGQWLGRPSMIAAFVGGITRPPEGSSNVTGLGATYGPELQRILGAQFVDLLARIHRFDWRGSALDAFDVPPPGSTEGVIRVINWWDRVWEEDSVEGLPIISMTSQWLRANAPPVDTIAVVHHDFRAGNFLYDPGTFKVTAVLDWELAHLGDFHEDIAWTLQRAYGYADTDGRFMVCGLIEREEFLRRYQEASGFVIDRRKLAYYEVLSCWKSAICVLATCPRCMIGSKTHQDVLVGWLSGFGPTCVEYLDRQLREVIHGS